MENENFENSFHKEGAHGILTTTADPSHKGHADALNYGFQKIENLDSLIVIPHFWNKAKHPIDIETRIRWMRETINEFLPEISSKIKVCDDLSIINDPHKFDAICNMYKDRIFRIIGDDKILEKVKNKNHAKILMSQRVCGRNSTFIKECIKNGNIDAIRNIVAKSVLEDILKNNYYR